MTRYCDECGDPSPCKCDAISAQQEMIADLQKSVREVLARAEAAERERDELAALLGAIELCDNCWAGERRRVILTKMTKAATYCDECGRKGPLVIRAGLGVHAEYIALCRKHARELAQKILRVLETKRRAKK